MLDNQSIPGEPTNKMISEALTAFYRYQGNVSAMTAALKVAIVAAPDRFMILDKKGYGLLAEAFAALEGSPDASQFNVSLIAGINRYLKNRPFPFESDTGWFISVIDRLPPVGQKVLGFAENSPVYAGCYFIAEHIGNGVWRFGLPITQWMPLPAAQVASSGMQVKREGS